MLVYWDANALASQHATGIVVYGSNLLSALQQFDDLEFEGLLKLSRLKRRRFISLHAHIRTKLYVPPMSDMFLKKDAVYHGIDFKIPDTHRLPRVVTIHDLGVFEEGFSEPEFRQEGMRYNTHLINTLKPERIIVPSAFGRDHLLRHFPHTRDIIRVIHHGSDHVHKYAVDGKISETAKQLMQEPFILVPGSIEKRKNTKCVIAAYSSANAARNYRIVFAGAKGYGFDAIESERQRSPFSEKILFTSGLSTADLIALYKASVFALYPSLFEGFGLPIAEAFALGTPLITSNTGAMAEIAGDAALTVDPGSVDAITAAIDTLAGNESTRQNLIAKGLDRAKEFSWKKAAAATRDVYLEIKP